ncbi:uncharacterized protein BX663DRAFT_439793 [Cokeromyces recurvatus]|uniref:uncharacterized protein n=1 Tax=Cokeromyces recurvatus TaxID=90255 RepID=UPI00222060B7|nr:uncharacterized protein BX663DRAFT_439793 [Cokeromyces recurvatus]KAI7900357.1 hypothetical protein BX663DRAFT_439793 [Cokeromyces recurvatus]
MFLDFVGYRNELSMISMILGLLNTRLITLTTTSIMGDDLTDCQRYALMYRKGQEDILNVTINKIEVMKRNLIQRMYQDQQNHKIAPSAPFLSIVNSTFYSHQLDMEEHLPFITLDNIVITPTKLLKKDLEFATIISENFEDLEEEADLIMMLCLIREYTTNGNSPWREFFDKVRSSNIIVSADQEADLKDMYDSIIPAFAEAYPKVFNLNSFTFELFVWADHILNHFSIENPFAIIPL